MPTTTKHPSWHAAHGCRRGKGHVAAGTPCQDAALARGGRRAFAIVCDGRGSAARSHLGSAHAVRRFAQLLRDAEPILRRVLDQSLASPQSQGLWRRFAHIAFDALAHGNAQLARIHGHHAREFDYTLVAVVAGIRHCGWLHVGDGFITELRGPNPLIVSTGHRGRFANETRFVHPAARDRDRIRHGLRSTCGLRGLCVCTDGAEPLLLHYATNRPANAIASVLSNLVADPSAPLLATLLDLPGWNTCTDDDRSMGLIARRPRITLASDRTALVSNTNPRQPLPPNR